VVPHDIVSCQEEVFMCMYLVDLKRTDVHDDLMRVQKSLCFVFHVRIDEFELVGCAHPSIHGTWLHDASMTGKALDSVNLKSLSNNFSLSLSMPCLCKT